MQAVGINPDTGLVEVVEVANHPWFVGTQYHPEYKSTVLKPSPLFVAFCRSGAQIRRGKEVITAQSKKQTRLDG